LAAFTNLIGLGKLGHGSSVSSSSNTSFMIVVAGLNMSAMASFLALAVIRAVMPLIVRTKNPGQTSL